MVAKGWHCSRYVAASSQTRNVGEIEIRKILPVIDIPLRLIAISAFGKASGEARPLERFHQETYVQSDPATDRGSSVDRRVSLDTS